MASADLVNLINLSLGAEPNGVVNFNYLHTLLHEIVARLTDHESVLEASGGYDMLERSLEDDHTLIAQDYQVEGTPSIVSTATDGGTKDDKQTSHRKDASVSGQKRGTSGKKKESQKGGGAESRDGKKSPELERAGSRKSSAGSVKGDQPLEQKDRGMTAKGEDKSIPVDLSSKDITGEQQLGDGVTGKPSQKADGAPSKPHKGDGGAVADSGKEIYGDDRRPRVSRFQPRARGVRSVRTTPPKEAESKDAEGPMFTGRRKMISLHAPLRSRVSSSTSGGNNYSKSFPGFSMAANDVSALEKQLLDIEVRLGAVEAVPELLSMKASDSNAKPLSDMWNFSNMDHRLHAAEKNTAKVAKMVDDLLGEIHNMNELSKEQREQLEMCSSGLSLVQDKLKDLDSMKDTVNEMASKSVSAQSLKDLQDQVEGLRSDTEGLKTQLSTVGVNTDGSFATKEELNDAIAELKKEQDEVLRVHESSLQEHQDSLSGLEKAVESVNNLNERVETAEEKAVEQAQSIEDIQAQLKTKLDADALAGLTPSGDASAADLLMPKLLELQNKVSQMESKLDGLPPDLKDQIADLRKNIESQTDELSSLTSKVTSLGDLSHMSDGTENLNREVSQLRERLTEVDRALMAISSMVTASMKEDQVEEDEADSGADSEELKRVKSALHRVQQENERLLGTAAHISHEMEVNKEHIKCLYGNVDELKQGKVDKSHLELQVKEKADRKALDEKASKTWVKSNFEELDRQIREAMAHMMEREEAMKMVNDLNENVDGKVDRLELQPFKDYVEKRLRVRETRKMESRTSLGEDAAGLKKPLRFSCLSCDKPLGVRPHQAIPALPSVTVFPGSRSFRPYTTFELELIRRQQKSGYPIPIQNFDTQRNARTAGGFHTVTHAYRRSRMVPGPFNAGTFTDYRNTVKYGSSNLVAQHLESDIVGADGHVYKGRIARDVKMQSIRASDRRLHHRPTSSPAQTQTNY